MAAQLLASLFPADINAIPAQYRIEPIHQREYLLNGEMRQWAGKVSEVYSPVCLPGLPMARCSVSWWAAIPLLVPPKRSKP